MSTVINPANYRKLNIACPAMKQVLDQWEAEPWVKVYYPFTKEEGFIDANGTKIAKAPSINGVQFPIPADVETKIPKMIYEHLQACEEQARIARMPMRSRHLGDLG